jgi:valyl-tRNA synthetase
MGVVFRDLLKLLHPAMPYLTEELWSHLVGDGLITTAPWPTPPAHTTPEGVGSLTELVSAVRSFRAQHGLSPRNEIDVLVVGDVPGWWAPYLRTLASVSATSVAEDPGPGHTRLLVSDRDAFLPLADLIDVDAERDRLAKALAEARGDAERAAAKLGNPAFVERAPEDVVAKERAKRAEADETVAGLEAQLAELG